MSLTISASGITFNDQTSLTTASVSGFSVTPGSINTLQLANNAVTLAKLGTDTNTRLLRARINYNTDDGTGANISYNVSSVTYRGIGSFQFNFNNAITGNYSAVATCYSSTINIPDIALTACIDSQTSNYVRILTGVFDSVTPEYFSLLNPTFINLVVFGN